MSQADENKLKVLKLIRDEKCKTDIDLFYLITPLKLNEREGGVFVFPNERGKIFDDLEKQLKAYSESKLITLRIDEQNMFHLTLTQGGIDWLNEGKTKKRQPEKEIVPEKMNLSEEVGAKKESSKTSSEDVKVLRMIQSGQQTNRRIVSLTKKGFLEDGKLTEKAIGLFAKELDGERLRMIKIREKTLDKYKKEI